MNPVLDDTRRFLRRHRGCALLIIPAAIAVTVVHETAHAVAVVAQGGTVVRFDWLPGEGRWGQVVYAFPENVAHSATAIALAPYALWFALAAVGAAVAFRRPELTFGRAVAVYFGLYVAPLGDVANTGFAYLMGRDNDFRAAFGAPTPVAGLAIAALGAAAFALGHPVQRRLYRDASAGLAAYLLLGTTATALTALAALWVSRA